MRKYSIMLILIILIVNGCSNQVINLDKKETLEISEDSINTVASEAGNSISNAQDDNIESINSVGNEVEDNISDTQDDNLESEEMVEDKENSINSPSLQLELAKEGRVNDLDFGIFSSIDEIIEIWGIPDRHDYYMGGYYLSYDEEKIFFNTNGYYEDGEFINGEVFLIGIYEANREIYGVRIGMTFDEIKAILIESSHIASPTDNMESELYGDNWTLSYNAGSNIVIFVADEENGPTDVVYLIKSN